jgi:hypothetical protein
MTPLTLDALMLQMAAGVFAKQPMRWSVLVQRVNDMKPVIVPAQKFLIDALLQCLEGLATYRPGHGSEPWELDGVFLIRANVEAYEKLPLHHAIRLVLSLHLAVYYDAPRLVQMGLVAELEVASAGIEGLVYEPQWLFLSAMACIRAGKPEEEIQAYQRRLEMYLKVVDWKHRMAIIDILLKMRRSWVDGLDAAEKKIEELNACKEHPLSGEITHDQADARSLGIPDWTANHPSYG